MGGETTLIRSLDPETAQRVFGARPMARADQLEACSRSSLMTYGHR
ncbi:hypothetical protein [Streptomyces griseus]